MKGLLGKIHFSRKVTIIIGGVLVLIGATGATAAYFGAGTLLGTSYKDRNGLQCTEIKSVPIRKKDRFWVRKFISVDGGDGLARVKTALRVASAAYNGGPEKPDLVQVIVLDRKGPTDRVDMRGRAVGADVVYIPDPSRVPEETTGQVFAARYVDKPANAEGQFYGEKISLPADVVERLFHALDDTSDCMKPEAPAADGHGSSGHGETGHEEAGHGDSADGDAGHGAAGASGHGEDGGHGEPSAHGEEADHAPESAHGEAAPESKGWLASITGMFFGSEDAAPEGGQEAPADAHGVAAKSAEGIRHGDEAAAHDTGEGEGSPHVPEAVQAKAELRLEAPSATGHNATSEEEPALLDRLKSLVWGSNSAENNARPPVQETLAKDVPEAGGDADEMGAAWLAKFKAKGVATEEPVTAEEAGHADELAEEPSSSGPTAGVHDVPAEDSDWLPPKASDKKAKEQAEAGH